MRLSVILYQIASVWLRMTIRNRSVPLFIGDCTKRTDLSLVTNMMTCSQKGKVMENSKVIYSVIFRGIQ